MGERLVLAIDLGASSGRGVLGRYDPLTRQLKTEEVHRFPNRYVRIHGGLYWDYVGLYNGILDCLRACKKRELELECIAIDGWAQDYAFVGEGGQILGLPRSYRDPAPMSRAGDLERHLCMDEKRFYLRSGGTFSAISTARQLYYDRRFRPDLFQQAKYWLHMPYLFVYLLSDVAGYDVTIPALGELYDVRTADISGETATALGIERMLPPRFQSGTVMAHTNKTVLEATGYDALPIACIDAHDTSSAVDAIPDLQDFLWISSGTYNMFGAVVREPVLNDALFQMSSRNTPLGDGRICLMCGAAGMYYIQQCMDVWKERGMAVTYPELTAWALAHESDVWFDFGDLPSASTDMPTELAAAIKKQGFVQPETPGELYVAFANSLARVTARELLRLEQALGRSFDRVYIMGGGSRADAINLRIAKLTGKRLYTGLVEAASVGNLLQQLIAIGEIKRDEMPEICTNSFALREFQRC